MMHSRYSGTAALILLATLTACGGRPSGTARPGDLDSVPRLPTGAELDPQGHLIDVGPLPVAIVQSPDADRVVLLLSGYKDTGIQVVQPSTGQVLQTIPLPATFVGLAFDSAGRNLYVSGGNRDLVYRFDWRNGT